MTLEEFCSKKERLVRFGFHTDLYWTLAASSIFLIWNLFNNAIKPYLEVFIEGSGILYCSVFFVTKHCHVQNGLAAHAVNKNQESVSEHSTPLQQQFFSPSLRTYTSILLQIKESLCFLPHISQIWSSHSGCQRKIGTVREVDAQLLTGVMGLIYPVSRADFGMFNHGFNYTVQKPRQSNHIPPSS